MLLTVVAIFSIVGVALAFKPPKVNGNLFCADIQFAPCLTDVVYNLETQLPKFCRDFKASGACDILVVVNIEE